jgi:photosystem II stability/assembly factor-like uncharacterized protein
MYFAAFDSVAFVGDGDANRRVLADREPTCVAAGGSRYCGTTDGLYREGDDGFERVYGGHVTSVAVAPDGTLYAGTEPTRLVRSTDGGDSWAVCADPTTLDSADSWAFPPRPETHHARAVAVGGVGDALDLAVEAGALVRSFDGGDSWVDRVPGGPRDSHSLAVHPDAPDRVYAAAGDGFFVSDDRGDSWERRESGLDRRYCWSVAVAPDDVDEVYCSAATGPGAAHGRTAPESYVYRSDDAGRSWTRLDAAPAGNGTTRPVLVADEDAVWSLSNRGLHRSDDAGATWTRVVPFPVGNATASGLLVDRPEVS